MQATSKEFIIALDEGTTNAKAVVLDSHGQVVVKFSQPLALQTPLWFAACIAVLFVAALASSTHDIVCDGLYIASLSDKQQAAYAGWQGAFFNAGKFISLGGLVILAGYLEKHIGVKPDRKSVV
mgnify:CR=1 FL=1